MSTPYRRNRGSNVARKHSASYACGSAVEYQETWVITTTQGVLARSTAASVFSSQAYIGSAGVHATGSNV
jgi:hypothetical protein